MSVTTMMLPSRNASTRESRPSSPRRETPRLCAVPPSPAPGLAGAGSAETLIALSGGARLDRDHFDFRGGPLIARFGFDVRCNGRLVEELQTGVGFGRTGQRSGHVPLEQLEDW